MSTKVIPERSIVTCDCCRREIGTDGVNRAMNGAMKIRRAALDYAGYPCASADVELDLCDSCLTTVCAAVNKACEGVRAAMQEAGR